MVLCNILGCNTEANFKVMFHHFDRFHKKPFCKEIMRVCEEHAVHLSDEDMVTKIQVMG